MASLPRIGIRLHGGLPPQRCVELARAAEAAGFDAVWFAENAFARGILPAASACAAATQRLQIGAGVFNPYSRHPTMMAMEISALDELAGGRAVLSLGAGIGSAVAKIGHNAEKPLPALRDALLIVRGLLRGEEVDHEGRAFSARKVRLDHPARADLPILLAGRGERTLALAGELADGIIISNMCSAEFARGAAAQVQRSRSGAGRAGTAMVVQYMPAAVAADPAVAQQAGRRAVGEMVPNFWTLSRKIAAAREGLLAGTGIAEAEFEAAATAIRAGEDPAAALDDRFPAAFSLTGTPEQCLASAHAYAAAGVTDLALTFDGADALDAITLLGRALDDAR